jgi:hypothetical protein
MPGPPDVVHGGGCSRSEPNVLSAFGAPPRGPDVVEQLSTMSWTGGPVMGDREPVRLVPDRWSR